MKRFLENTARKVADTQRFCYKTPKFILEILIKQVHKLQVLT